MIVLSYLKPLTWRVESTETVLFSDFRLCLLISPQKNFECKWNLVRKLTKKQMFPLVSNNNRSCVQKASAVKHQSIPSLDPPLD